MDRFNGASSCNPWDRCDNLGSPLYCDACGGKDDEEGWNDDEEGGNDDGGNCDDEEGGNCDEEEGGKDDEEGGKKVEEEAVVQIGGFEGEGGLGRVRGVDTGGVHRLG